MPDAPHPRILFHSVPKDLLPSLASLAGTSLAIGDDEVRTVHPSDWDLIVSFAWRPYVGVAMPVLSFGGGSFPTWLHEGRTYATERDVPLLARGLEIPSQLKGPIRSLIHRSIVENDPGPGNRYGLSRRPPGSAPIVTVGEEKRVWAAILSYPRDVRIWALPKETTEHVAWLAEMLRVLHHTDPDRFPAAADWRTSSEWGIPEVRRATDALRVIEEERAELLSALDAREASAREAKELAIQLGQSGAQRLLTEQGEALVDAVAEALRFLGFDVADMDDHHDERLGAKLEDLRATYSTGSGEWTCLVEVKGYGKGAKANDVGQIIGRPPLVFLKEAGREADALWHIVNSNREQDPSARPKALTSGGDLVALADAGGCFIDTRDLFRAWRDVEEGTATAEDVRASLMAGRERWEWPAKGSGS